MGFFDRLLAGKRRPHDEVQLFEAGIIEEPDVSSLVEIEVVGEGPRQDALERIAGAKTERGKSHPVGATLRCEPTNPHDSNAVRVEVMGQHVGYVRRDIAARLAPRLSQAGGAVEVRGLIVGGWDDGVTQGYYGIRVFLEPHEADRLNVEPTPLPTLPTPGPGEVRLTPDDDAYVTSVTVTCEEHYQDAIVASMPQPWNRDWWPALATIVLADCNPHSSRADCCLEVRIGDMTVGYLTPKMTERHRPSIDSAGGAPVTARAEISKGQKAGTEIWRVKLCVRAQT